MPSLIDNIRKSGIVGRGGAAFPTADKWEMVQKAQGSPKHVVCNASEGEMGVFKDYFILENHLDKVLKGMILAMDFLGTQHATINLNSNYYQKLKKNLNPALKQLKEKGYEFTVFEEDPSYIGGEETALLNAIEGQRVQPRLKPPFPVEVGLFGKPTLVNNVETFYDVALVSEGAYKGDRFYSITGEAKNPGTFALPSTLTLHEILQKTKNLPKFPFFAQVGGSASGLMLNSDQLKDQKMVGAGAIEIYRMDMAPRDLLLKWFKFYAEESCGKCTPCREGTYHLYELLKKQKSIPWDQIMEIVEAMEKTSFCALGRSIGVPVKSYRENVLRI